MILFDVAVFPPPHLICLTILLQIMLGAVLFYRSFFPFFISLLVKKSGSILIDAAHFFFARLPTLCYLTTKTINFL